MAKIKTKTRIPKEVLQEAAGFVEIFKSVHAQAVETLSSMPSTAHLADDTQYLEHLRAAFIKFMKDRQKQAQKDSIQ